MTYCSAAAGPEDESRALQAHDDPLKTSLQGHRAHTRTKSRLRKSSSGARGTGSRVPSRAMTFLYLIVPLAPIILSQLITGAPALDKYTAVL